jgi:hypothetical protein
MSRFGFLESTINTLNTLEFTPVEHDFRTHFNTASNYKSRFGSLLAKNSGFGKLSFGRKPVNQDSDSDSDSDDELNFGNADSDSDSDDGELNFGDDSDSDSDNELEFGSSAAQRKNHSNASKAMKMAAKKGISLKAAWKIVKK